LIITDNAGCVSDVCHEMGITSPATSEANFEAVVGEHPNVFIFHNHSFGYGEHTSWFWDFGDGHTSDNFDPHHAYESPGIYTVCLTMVNLDNGFLDKFCTEITFGMVVSESGYGQDLNHDAKSPENNNAFASDPVIKFRYSNPVKEELILQYELSEDALIGFELYNISGNRVISRYQARESVGVHDVSLSTVTLIPGVYALHMTVNNQRIVRTILIMQ